MRTVSVRLCDECIGEVEEDGSLSFVIDPEGLEDGDCECCGMQGREGDGGMFPAVVKEEHGVSCGGSDEPSILGATVTVRADSLRPAYVPPLLELAKEILADNRRRGFSTGENTTATTAISVALVASEAFEMLEELRATPKGEPLASKKFLLEWADVFIRLFDLSEKLDVTEEALLAVREKMDINKTRPFKHGGKRF